VGLTIAEGKALLASLQEQVVTGQVQQHAATFRSCPKCGNPFRRKGHYQSTLLETIRYLELNADSMPDYGKRYSAGQRISTGFVESAVNEIIAKRMVKKQQMRWNRQTVQRFLDVRIHVLNGTLEDAFRHWHKGFQPVVDQTHLALSA
jgi:hypothetical protein